MRLWLKTKRSSANKTQSAVAKEAGIKQPTYFNIENGLRNPSVKVAKRIAEVLGFDWTMFFETDAKETETT